MPSADHQMDPAPFKIITPVGMLGYGYNYQLFEEVCRKDDISFICVDSGSTDSGPQKLALGSMTCPREAYVRDLEPLLRVSAIHKIPVLIGSAGGDGSNAHVDEFVAMVKEISAAQGYSFNVARIYAEVEAEVVVESIESGLVTPCGPVRELSVEEARKATTIVAQMGAEPFMEALVRGADIIIAGRAYDPSPFAAVCLLRGIDPGVAWHMGKICECGALCATPKGRSIVATVRKDSFDLESIAEEERCTIVSVAAHTLYEKSRPDKLTGPGGILDLTESKYKQISDRSVRVSGGIFHTMPYTVKLEGARPVGYRTCFIGGIRDPILISQIETIIPAIEEYVKGMTPDFDPFTDKFAFHVYGKNGVMGSLEPDSIQPLEICVMGEVLSTTQIRANGMASLARVALMHCPYPGQMATAGNFASPLTPLENPLGQVCEFTVYHILPISDPLSLFPITVEQVSNGSSTNPSKLNGATGVFEPAKFRRPPTIRPSPKPSMKELVGSGRTSATIAELAQIVRSKNAGPFELTFDVMFDDPETYHWVKKSSSFSSSAMASAFKIKEESIIACMFYDPARAFKFTIPRAQSQGGFGETDMHGCQQHIPLMRVEVSLPARE